MPMVKKENALTKSTSVHARAAFLLAGRAKELFADWVSEQLGRLEEESALTPAAS